MKGEPHNNQDKKYCTGIGGQSCENKRMRRASPEDRPVYAETKTPCGKRVHRRQHGPRNQRGASRQMIVYEKKTGGANAHFRPRYSPYLKHQAEEKTPPVRQATRKAHATIGCERRTTPCLPHTDRTASRPRKAYTARPNAPGQTTGAAYRRDAHATAHRPVPQCTQRWAAPWRRTRAGQSTASQCPHTKPPAGAATAPSPRRHRLPRRTGRPDGPA